MSTPNAHPTPHRVTPSTFTHRRATLGLVMGLSLLFALLGWVYAAQPSQAQAPHTAYLSVQFADDDAVVRAVPFSGTVSGLDLLLDTNLEVITYDAGFGIAVCSIEGVGCPADDCFCSSNYWGYNRWTGSAWEGYMVGADQSVISTTEAVEGWRWGPFGSALIPGDRAVATWAGLEWLASRQITDTGGYSSMGNAAEVMFALGANRQRASEWQRTPASPSLDDYVYQNSGEYTTYGVAAAAKIARGVAAAQARLPLTATLPLSYYVESSGVFTGGYAAGSAGPQAWGILGTLALGDSVPLTATEYLKSLVNPDGGWSWAEGDDSASDTNGTALALEALVKAGEPLTSSVVISAVRYLQNTQNADGGWPYTPAETATASDANSTAYVVQALRTVRQVSAQNEAGTSQFGTGTLPFTLLQGDPVEFLLGLQEADGGFAWQSGSNFGASQLSTQQVIPVLLSQPFVVSQPSLQRIFLPLVLK